MIELYHDCMQRRKLLQGISAGGVGLGLVQPAVALSNSDGHDLVDVTVKELKRGGRRRILRQVRNDDDVRKLINEVANDGWEPQWDSATADRVIVNARNRSGKYNTSIVNFRNEESSLEEMFLVWTGNNTLETDNLNPIIHHLEKEGGGLQTLDESAGLGRYEKSTAYTVDDGVNIDTGEFFPEANIESENEKSEIQTHNTEYCSVDFCVSEEDEVSLSCVARAIINAGLAGYTCIGSTISWPAIFACLISLGMTYDQINQCGFDCDNEAHEVEREWLEDTIQEDTVAVNGIEDPCSYYSSENERNIPIVEEQLDEIPTR